MAMNHPWFGHVCRKTGLAVDFFQPIVPYRAGTNVFIGLLYRFFFSNNTHNLAPFIGFCFISLAATRMAFTILS